jgi:hypothetical protein
MKAETLLNKIPKAQVDYIKVTKKDLKKAMIEFAKLHVEAALKAAAENAETRYIPYTDDDYEIDKRSILNAYSLENIK